MAELVHPKTSKLVDNFINTPSQALLLAGAAGSGKRLLAETIIERIGSIDFQNILVVEPDQQSLKIDQIRSILSFVKLKTSGSEAYRRAIIIEAAELFTIEAQNAFLKLLEEPPADTIIILLSEDKSKLLPTITSRLQSIDVLPVSLEQALMQLSEFGQDKIVPAHSLAEGKARLIKELLNDGENNELPIAEVKKFLSADYYDRLLQIEPLQKDKAKLKIFIDTILIVCSSGYKTYLAKGDSKQHARWHKAAKQALILQDKMRKNVNARLIAINLALGV